MDDADLPLQNRGEMMPLYIRASPPNTQEADILPPNYVQPLIDMRNVCLHYAATGRPDTCDCLLKERDRLREAKVFFKTFKKFYSYIIIYILK